jgi:hypothetical protein
MGSGLSSGSELTIRNVSSCMQAAEVGPSCVVMQAIRFIGLLHHRAAQNLAQRLPGLQSQLQQLQSDMKGAQDAATQAAAAFDMITAMQKEQRVNDTKAVITRVTSQWRGLM